MDLLELISENEDVQKQFQAEVDRAVTKAIQTRDKKHQEELKKQEQRAKMTASEIQSEKERELREREDKLRQAELKLAKIDYFKENDIPLDFVDLVNVSSEDEIESKAKSIMGVLESQVEKQVKKKIQSNGYEINDNKTKDLELEDFANMDIDDINENWDKLLS